MTKVMLPFLRGISVLWMLFFAYPVSSNGQSRGINFTEAKNWNEVLTLAKETHRNIFVDAYTTWCGPCKMMDQQTYPDSLLGGIFDKDYVSVKIQMDKTSADKPSIQSWYYDAEMLMKSAQVEAFPTLLFFSANGDLLFKAIGFKSSSALAKIAKYISDTSAVKSFNNALSDYVAGKKNYETLPDLILTTLEVSGDKGLAAKMALDYKTNFLDKLKADKFITPENIRFIAENGGVSLVNSHDHFFSTSYNHPEIIDTVLGKGNAEYYVKAVITWEEVINKLYKDNKPVKVDPDWTKIRSGLKKYRKIDVDRFMLRSQIDFYRKLEKWDKYTRLRSEEIKKYPRKLSEMGIDDNLNFLAWDVFLHCQEKKALLRALEWSELSMELDQPSPDLQQYDTRANLLHKLGRTEEAIRFQKIAIEKNEQLIKKTGQNYFPEYVTNLEKMQQNKPTWPTK